MPPDLESPRNSGHDDCGHGGETSRNSGIEGDGSGYTEYNEEKDFNKGEEDRDGDEAKKVSSPQATYKYNPTHY